MEESSVEGEWVREKIIGRGGSGTSVYLVRRAKTQRTQTQYIEFQSFLPSVMAVKSALFTDAASILYEQMIFTQLKSCPYILKCYGKSLTIENTRKIYNLWLEYAPGGSLYDRIKKISSTSIGDNGGCNGLPEIEVRRYTYSILGGIKHIHQCGFVHCDLKPQNILICENNVAKIADFGLSVKTNQHKMKSRFRGTVDYAAPEAITSESYEPKSDVWGLGCIVLEMLSGKRPWSFVPDIESSSILYFIAYSKELPMVPIKLSALAVDFLRKCLVRDISLRWTPDMLLKHPFVAETSGIQSPIDFGLPWPNLPSFGLRSIQELLQKIHSNNSMWGNHEQTEDAATKKAKKEELQSGLVEAIVPSIGAKRKNALMGDNEELTESICSNTITKDNNETHNQFQLRYWGVRRCSMPPGKSVDAVPFGFSRALTNYNKCRTILILTSETIQSYNENVGFKYYSENPSPLVNLEYIITSSPYGSMSYDTEFHTKYG